jgi:hypothetical protein
VLGTAEADSLGAVAAGLGGLLRLVGVGPDLEPADLVGPAEDLLELGLVFDLEKSLIEQIRGNYFLEVGIIFASAAINALDVGQTAWAEWCLSQGQALCRPYQDPVSQAAFHRGLAALHLEKAEWDQAG